MAFGFGMGFPRNEPFAGGPSLNLQFAGNTVLDPAITFTRALNTATYFDSAGVLTTANANVARFDYDPATLAPRGLLIEEARTNLILQSRDMTQAAWTKIDVTPNRNQVGLDGVANTACLLTEGSAGIAVTFQTGATVTAGSIITGSMVLKRGNTDWVRVYVQDGVADGANAWFNLATGAKGSVTARGTGTSNSSTITSLGGGWYRCTVTSTPNGIYTTPQIAVVSASADGSGTRVSGATYIVDCAQLEVGAFATSIIPTTTTTLTRNADNAVMTGTNFSSWFNASAGSFFVEWDQTGITGASGVLAANDNTASNRIDLRSQSGYKSFIDRTGVSQAILAPTGSVAVNTTYKYGLAYDTNDAAFVVNAGAAATDTSVTLPIVTQLRIGALDGGGNHLNGHIRSLSFYPRRLSNAELQAITS